MSSYYDILEIERSATEEEIRRSYKRLALKYHPDKNPENREEAEEHFKKVSEAYATLSDPVKRRTYDMCGSVDESGGSPFNPFDVFQSMFQGGVGVPSFAFERNVDLGDLLGGAGAGNGIKISVHTFSPMMGHMGSVPPIDLSRIHEYMSECGIDVDAELDRARSFGMPNIDELLHHVQSLKSKIGGTHGKKKKVKEVVKEIKERPEDVVYDLYVSLADIYSGASKKVSYLIFKDGKEVKKSATIPLQGKVVMLEGAGHKMDGYRERGNVIFNIYAKEESEETDGKDDTGFTRVNQYDLLTHRVFDFTLGSGSKDSGAIFIDLFGVKRLKCVVVPKKFQKLPYVGVVEGAGLIGEEGSRGNLYILFSNGKVEEEKEEDGEWEHVEVKNTSYKELFKERL